MGKRSGMDAERRKSTYPSLVGLDESKRLADEAVSAALGALDSYGPDADPLRDLARYVVAREK